MVGDTVLDRLGAPLVQFGNASALLDDLIDLRQARLEVHKELLAPVETEQGDRHIEEGAQVHEQVVAQPADAVAGIEEGQAEALHQVDAQIGGQVEAGHNHHHGIVQHKVRPRLLAV